MGSGCGAGKSRCGPNIWSGACTMSSGTSGSSEPPLSVPALDQHAVGRVAAASRLGSKRSHRKSGSVPTGLQSIGAVVPKSLASRVMRRVRDQNDFVRSLVPDLYQALVDAGAPPSLPGGLLHVAYHHGAKLLEKLQAIGTARVGLLQRDLAMRGAVDAAAAMAPLPRRAGQYDHDSDGSDEEVCPRSPCVLLPSAMCSCHVARAVRGGSTREDMLLTVRALLPRMRRQRVGRGLRRSSTRPTGRRCSASWSGSTRRSPAAPMA
jgi:hypothetical protein